MYIQVDTSYLPQHTRCLSGPLEYIYIHSFPGTPCYCVSHQVCTYVQLGHKASANSMYFNNPHAVDERDYSVHYKKQPVLQYKRMYLPMMYKLTKHSNTADNC
jgi:hypothetical protein